MNLHCTIYSDNLNRDMVKGSDVIYLGNYTTLDNVIEQTYFNDSEFRLLGVHFPFDMIENILQAGRCRASLHNWGDLYPDPVFYLYELEISQEFVPNGCTRHGTEVHAHGRSSQAP